MPKLIDYPRTSYTGAWELAEITDDTGGKCTIENAARKLNRKVSGSFKAIIGSAVKFGLITSKRELLTTTTLFKRIKHAYDKQEELTFHREAFLTPPLFTQICRKFRSRELPVQMLDVMLIREFGVEEINAPGVAKAFVDGCRMVGILDERNIIADIDAFKAAQGSRRELASPQPQTNVFRGLPEIDNLVSQKQPNGESDLNTAATDDAVALQNVKKSSVTPDGTPIGKNNSQENTDAVASLFGFFETTPRQEAALKVEKLEAPDEMRKNVHHQSSEAHVTPPIATFPVTDHREYQLQVSGPGINTVLSITEEEDVAIAIALLEKIRRQLKN
ncbi:hypothetical protein ACFP2F_08425 [Hymenobacter artigasi]|uniref:Uncharacterized protein n=1 Tax=Hymenobacter artigasi TaxID=2719616 RepID=A0ABX1HHD5_9BACT|nr:hypothetical protein [Hymenobacter artigasi]NKI89279.1 hypothetical protein [Hymenobacter artigasi]